MASPKSRSPPWALGPARCRCRCCPWVALRCRCRRCRCRCRCSCHGPPRKCGRRRGNIDPAVRQGEKTGSWRGQKWWFHGFNVVCWFEDEHFEVEDSKLNDVWCGEIPNGIPKKMVFSISGEMWWNMCVYIYISVISFTLLCFKVGI